MTPILAQFNGKPIIDWSWIGRHLNEIGERILQHLVLTGIAVGIGFVLSMTCVMLVVRYRKTYGPITWVTAMLYTIPGVALFAMLLPWTGLTMLTAEIGLVSYTLLILIRNIVAGIDAVPDSIIEAARGMGFGRWRIFFEVQLPLATSAIIAGLRIATVTTVGLVTVTALIGYGGLGFFILNGLQWFSMSQIIVGSVLSVALAVVLDIALIGVEWLITPWTRRSVAAP